MFVDFVKKDGDMAKMDVQMMRRNVKSKMAQAIYRPCTKAQLTNKHHDVEYVELIIADAVKRRRVEKDRLAPNDAEKVRYWVLDDESLTFSSLAELEMSLNIGLEVSQETATQLTSSGGYFGDGGGEVSTGGVGAAEAARLADLHTEPAAQPQLQELGNGSGDANQGTLPTPKAKAKAKAKGKAGAEALSKETSIQLAKKMVSELSRLIGNGAKVIVDCTRADIGPVLIGQLESAVKSMKDQHNLLDSEVAKKIAEPTDYYDGMVENSKKIIAYFNNRTAYAKALNGVTKRLDS